jgi:DNA gyrase subunit B
MKKLTDGVRVYTRAPSLKVKNGSRESTSGEGELEELLLADKLEAFVDGLCGQGGSSSTALADSPSLKAVEGWSSTLRRSSANGPSTSSRMPSCSAGVKTLAAAAKLFRRGTQGRPYETKLSTRDHGFVVKGTPPQRPARTTTFPRPVRLQPYKSSSTPTPRSSGHGQAPVRDQPRRARGEAESFSELRREILELARHGVTLSRFKGLGEMNAEQLRETTMDPETRTLQQVSIDEAAASGLEQTFSDLMGDKVEPRKEFIERHARDVRFLDV